MNTRIVLSSLLLALLSCDNAAHNITEENTTDTANLSGSDASVDIARPPQGLLHGTWIGGEDIGGCIDHASWLSFGDAQAFTFGHLNNNACMDEELRGVGTCDGTFEIADTHTLIMRCTSEREPPLPLTDLTMTSTFVKRGEELLFKVYAPTSTPDLWHRRVQADSVRQSVLGDPGIYTELREIRVDLSIPGWTEAEPGMTIGVEAHIVASREGTEPYIPPSSMLDITLRYRATITEEDGVRYLTANMAIDSDYPGDAWWTFIKEQPGVTDETFAFGLEALDYKLFYDAEHHTWISATGRGYGSYQPLPLSWRKSDIEPCEAFASVRSYNPSFDTWCW